MYSVADPIRIGPKIVAMWSLLAISKRWRSEASGIDRLFRCYSLPGTLTDGPSHGPLSDAHVELVVPVAVFPAASERRVQHARNCLSDQVVAGLSLRVAREEVA